MGWSDECGEANIALTGWDARKRAPSSDYGWEQGARIKDARIARRARVAS